MSERDWKPGDVALYTGPTPNEVAFLVPRCANEMHGTGSHWHHSGGGWNHHPVIRPALYRPLVVIDPEDAEQVERLIRAFADARATQSQRYDGGWWAAIVEETQAALVRLARPPEAFEHYPAPTSPANGVLNSLCGKVWKPKPVTVMGRCPECTAIVDKGWVS